MKSNWLGGWFRWLLMATTLSLLVALVRSQWGGAVWPYLCTLSGFLGLWLFVDLCRDIRRIRLFLDSLDFEDKSGTPENRPWEPPTTSRSIGLEGLLDIKSAKRIGDRVFKADGTKTCSSCKHYRTEEKTCAIDSAGLGGVTVTAVGCQHWVPGLRVTAGDLNQGAPLTPERTEPS